MTVFVVGAGGHAKVIVALIEACGDVVGGVFDGDPKRVGTFVLGHPVRALRELPAANANDANHDDDDDDAAVVVAIGVNATRQRVVSELGPRRFASLVHPRAWVAPSARVEAGAVVFAGAIVQPDAVIGAHAIVNTGATVDHDCVVGAFAHIAPGCHLCGNVVVAEGAFVGVGASVIPGRTIGAWATVGAGGVVAKDIQPRAVVKGVPAK